MTHGSKENPEGLIDGKPKRPGLIDQWGGKQAFFFTYTHLSNDLTTGLLGALLPFIREDLKLNYLQSGFLVSVFALISGLSQLLGGWASDRIGRQKSIALGLGGIGLSAIAIGLAPSYYFLLAIMVVMGICAGFYHPSAIATVTTHFSAKQRGRVVALHMIGGSLGFGIGPLLGALISRYSSWHLAYIILGFPALVAAFLVLTKLKLPGQNIKSKDTIPSQADGQKRIGVWQVFKPAFSIIAVSVTMQLVTGPVVSFASLYMVDVHHLSAAAGSMWVSLIRLGGMAGSLCGGWLSDKWGRKNTVFLSLLLYGPVVFLVAKLPLGIAFGAAFIILGGLMSMRETTMQAYLMDNTPPELRATVIGIYFGFGQEGSSIVQPIAGNLMDNIGIRGVYNAISMITLFMSAIVVLLIFRNARQNRISGGIPKSE